MLFPELLMPFSLINLETIVLVLDVFCLLVLIENRIKTFGHDVFFRVDLNIITLKPCVLISFSLQQSLELPHRFAQTFQLCHLV